MTPPFSWSNDIYNSTCIHEFALINSADSDALSNDNSANHEFILYITVNKFKIGTLC